MLLRDKTEAGGKQRRPEFKNSQPGGCKKHIKCSCKLDKIRTKLLHFGDYSFCGFAGESLQHTASVAVIHATSAFIMHVKSKMGMWLEHFSPSLQNFTTMISLIMQNIRFLFQTKI